MQLMSMDHGLLTSGIVTQRNLNKQELEADRLSVSVLAPNLRKSALSVYIRFRPKVVVPLSV